MTNIADALLLTDLILRLAELASGILTGHATSEDVKEAQIEAGKALEVLRKKIERVDAFGEPETELSPDA